jgi:hypothetical protein
MPIVSQESVHAKPQQLPANLAEIATIWDKLPAAIHSAIITTNVKYLAILHLIKILFAT